MRDPFKPRAPERKPLPPLFLRPRRWTAQLGIFYVASFVMGLGVGCLLLPPFSATSDLIIPSKTPLRVCFSPGGNCTTLIVSAIENSQYSIHVMAFSFTSPEIARALIRAAHRGVLVKVLVDKSQLRERYSQVPLLVQEKIPVSVDVAHGLAHNKVMIFDTETVLTGSFNFTRGAESRNAENILLIRNPKLAQAYMENWRERHAKARQIPAASLTPPSPRPFRREGPRTF